MKIRLFTLLFFVGFGLFSQNPTPKMPKYIAKNAAGIFYYDILEATSKVKLKKDDKKTAFSKALRNYNSKIKEISFLNMVKLNDVQLTVDSAGDQVYKNPDLRSKIMKLLQKNVHPVRDSILENEKILNASLKTLLNKKQYKKWLRYQRGEKNKLLPEVPQNNQNLNPQNNSIMRRRGGAGGFGGNRF